MATIPDRDARIKDTGENRVNRRGVVHPTCAGGMNLPAVESAAYRESTREATAHAQIRINLLSPDKSTYSNYRFAVKIL